MTVCGNLPEGWEWTTLGCLCCVQSGITKGKRRAAGVALRSVPYLRVANVQRGRLDLADVQSIEATEEEIRTLRLQPGDILLNEGGDRDKLGRGWVWQGQIAECIHQNHVFRARPVDGVLPSYVSWYTNSVGQAYFVGEGKQTTNLASISLTTLSLCPIPLPPLSEQRRIVAEIEKQFSRLDAAVEALKRAQTALRRYRASVLQAACEGRLVPTEAELARREGRGYETGDQLLARILRERRAQWEAEQLERMTAAGRPPTDDRWKAKYRAPDPPDTAGLPEMPEGWTYLRVREAGYVQLGRQRSPEHHAGSHMRPYLRVANVFEDRLDLSNVMEMNFKPAEWERFHLRDGDILLNEGQSLELVGRAALYQGEIPGACFQNTLLRFRAYPWIVRRYALTVFRAYLHAGRFQRIARWTTNIAHLGADRFALLPMPIPPLAEQHRIVAEVERRLSLLDGLEAAVYASLKRADRLRQSILSRAFEGKLVPQDPADEPASVLLERIRKDRGNAVPDRARPGRGNGRRRARVHTLPQASLPFGDR